MALTLFHFFNPSNVLSPFWPPKLIFREVNFQYYWGRVKSHLQRKKSEKTQMSLFYWFWAPSGPTLANRDPIGRRIIERIENRKKKQHWMPDNWAVPFWKGRQMITFSNKNHLNKKTKKNDRRWILCFTCKDQNKKTQKQRGKPGHGTGSRTRLSTLQKKLRRLQPQGVLFANAMLGDVSATGMSVLT